MVSQRKNSPSVAPLFINTNLITFKMLSIGDMLKEGTKHFSGKDEAILKNVEATASNLQDFTAASSLQTGSLVEPDNEVEILFFAAGSFLTRTGERHAGKFGDHKLEWQFSYC